MSERTYLPMDCPVCGRRRLLADIRDGHNQRPFVAHIECEKCGKEWPNDDDLAPGKEAT